MQKTKLALARVLPVTAEVNAAGRLAVGGCDLVDLAAEFGHGMGLDDPHACGESVMSLAGCLDLVHGWPPYPNDVCTPDILYGYSGPWGGRCQ